MTQLTTELVQGTDNTWTLKLIGSIDSDTHHLMWAANSSKDLLKRLVEAKTQKLWIDLAAVEWFDSHGLRLLLNAQKEFSKEKIEIVLKNPNPHLKRLFQIMQFGRVFTIESND
jgi:anti-anti-sigma factor